MKDLELFNIENDEDTAKFFEIVLWNLQRYFYCKTKEKGANLINRFLKEFPDYIDNDFHFQDGAFTVAARIFYEYELKNNKPDFVSWLREQGIFNTPYEAGEYFRRNYYNL